MITTLTPDLQVPRHPVFETRIVVSAARTASLIFLWSSAPPRAPQQGDPSSFVFVQTRMILRNLISGGVIVIGL